MKVRDLLEALRGMDPDAKLYVEAIDNDMAKPTRVAVKISHVDKVGLAGSSAAIVIIPKRRMQVGWSQLNPDEYSKRRIIRN